MRSDQKDLTEIQLNDFLQHLKSFAARKKITEPFVIHRLLEDISNELKKGNSALKTQKYTLFKYSLQISFIALAVPATTAFIYYYFACPLYQILSVRAPEDISYLDLCTKIDADERIHNQLSTLFGVVGCLWIFSGVYSYYKIKELFALLDGRINAKKQYKKLYQIQSFLYEKPIVAL